MTSPRFRFVACIAVLSLFAAACSSSDSGDDGSSTASTEAATTTTEPVDVPTTPASALSPPTTVTPAPIGFMAMTGLAAVDEATLRRPVIAAKIDNVEGARPQAGLSEADVVFEEIVEGGLTRLLAIFHSNDVAEIGPIRSARSTDVPLLTPLREPLFAWSGANSAFAALIRSVAIRDVGLEAEPDAYRRASDRRSPSNLMTSTDALYDLIDLDGDLAPNALFEHLRPGEPSMTGEPVAGVTVDYGGTSVTHTWDADAGGWSRVQNGTPHLDASGAQIAPTNVIVQFVGYLDTGLVDSAGAVVPEADLSGGGEAWFFLDGQLIEGTWTKPNVTANSQYADADGETMRLIPGSTWVLLARSGSATLL